MSVANSKMSEKKYWLWLEERQRGPYSVAQIGALAEVDEPSEEGEPEPAEVTRDTLYFSERLDEWRPLWRFPEEWVEDGYDRAGQASDCGINYLEFIGSGHDDDCDACKAYECQIVPVQPAPPSSPPGCKCQLWSRGVYIAVSDERAAVPFHIRREELAIQRENDRRSREAYAATLKQRRRKQ